MGRCEICDGPVVRGVAEWHSVCRSCGTEFSTFRPAINARDASIPPDEAVRAEGLAPLREEGYRHLLAQLSELRASPGGALLEVGSAHGWFVRAACGQFERVVGIEPDDAVRRSVDDPAVEIRAGYFPEMLAGDESFDVIAFNDVFEHIPRARTVARTVAASLQPGGLAVINLPVREGAIYGATRFLYQIGVRGPFERMWQKGFPSPHLYYFSGRGLVSLFGGAGFSLERKISMPTVRFRGLWPRIRYAEPRRAKAIAIYVSTLVALPILAMLPKDVQCFFFSRAKLFHDLPPQLRL